MSQQGKPYSFFGRELLPYHGNIAETGASVIVSTTGPTARLSNPVSEAIKQAAGGEEVMKAYLHGLQPIREGTVAITPAGNMAKTKYIFHVVPTARAKRRAASDEYIDRLTRRSIQIADLLEMESIAIPPMGAGRGQADKEKVVQVILEAATDSLRHCQYLRTLIFATTDPATYLHYHNRIMVSLVLEQRQREIVALLPLIPPDLYGDVGRVLLQMEAVRKQANRITDDVGLSVQDLKAQVDILAHNAGKLAQALPAGQGTDAMQALSATGENIVYNINIVIAGPGGAATLGNIEGNVIIGHGNVIGDTAR